MFFWGILFLNKHEYDITHIWLGIWHKDSQSYNHHVGMEFYVRFLDTKYGDRVVASGGKKVHRKSIIWPHIMMTSQDSLN